MAIYSLDGQAPDLPADGRYWIAETAVAIGRVRLAPIATLQAGMCPREISSPVAASITGQGYVAVNGQNLLYPAIGVTHAGKVVYTATLAGPGYFPSSVYATIDPTARGPSAG